MSFNPATIRYIKLGSGNSWAKRAFEAGELPFGYASVPHEHCLSGDWEGLVRWFMESEGKAQGKAQSQARNAARELEDFYTLGADCLWVTFADRRLWWCFAEPEVSWIDTPAEGQGNRVRRVIGEWRNTDLLGQPLSMANLSTQLTQVAAYRMTLCKIKHQDYLLRRIRGEAEPLIQEAEAARMALIQIAAKMIQALHWADFEVLVDLIFARSGWQRVSALGGTVADVDLELKEPATGMTAAVQVKSQASQAVLEDYIGRIDAGGQHGRLFFVCHSPAGTLAAPERSDVHVWAGAKLAETAVTLGLFDWLLEKSA